MVIRHYGPAVEARHLAQLLIQPPSDVNAVSGGRHVWWSCFHADLRLVLVGADDNTLKASRYKRRFGL